MHVEVRIVCMRVYVTTRNFVFTDTVVSTGVCIRCEHKVLGHTHVTADPHTRSRSDALPGRPLPSSAVRSRARSRMSHPGPRLRAFILHARPNFTHLSYISRNVYVPLCFSSLRAAARREVIGHSQTHTSLQATCALSAPSCSTATGGSGCTSKEVLMCLALAGRSV